MMRLLLFIHALMFSAFAIIDVGTVDFGEKPEGFSGAAFGTFQKKRGNTDKDEMEYGGRIQYDTPETITWLQGAIEKDQASSVVTDDNAFIHLRHIHQLFDPTWAMEFYTQAKKDRFRYVQNRSVYGIGPRYKIADSEQYGKLFVGASALDERISYTQKELHPDEHNYRLSSYLSYTIKMDKNLEFRHLGYYQPKFDKASDFTASVTAEMMIHLTQVIDLSYQLEFDYDAEPVAGVQKNDTRQRLAFVYRFGKDDPLSSYAQALLKSTKEPKRSAPAIAETQRESTQSCAGEWVSQEKRLLILDSGAGNFSDAEGVYSDMLHWTLATAENKSARVLTLRFVDQEGRPGRVENYLWSEDTLIGFSDGSPLLFTREHSPLKP